MKSKDQQHLEEAYASIFEKTVENILNESDTGLGGISVGKAIKKLGKLIQEFNGTDWQFLIWVEAPGVDVDEAWSPVTNVINDKTSVGLEAAWNVKGSKPMTAKNLLDQLSQMNSDADLYVEDGGADYPVSKIGASSKNKVFYAK